MWFFGLFFLLISMCWAGPAPISRTIYVNWKGGQDFKKIQDAVNSIPMNNNQWVHIYIATGTYMEAVTVDRPYIFMEGDWQGHTFIDYSNSNTTLQSNTIAITADNFVAKYMGFKNNYNHPSIVDGNRRPAVAARVSGDKAAFYHCSFLGVQDTLWDDHGRHYYQSCYIEGCVDFVFGGGQSQFENCTLYVNGNKIGDNPGYITAQGRERSSDTNGFVFKSCTVEGVGKVYLGRAWRAFARVLFYQSNLNSVVLPQGWQPGPGINVADLTFAESGCSGPGSDRSKRVGWEKQLNAGDLNMLTSRSFIDSDGWIEQQP